MIHRPVGRAGTAFLLIAMVCLPALADPSATLTLPEAVHQAESSSPDVMAAKAKIAEGRGAMAEATSHWLPTLSLVAAPFDLGSPDQPLSTLIGALPNYATLAIGSGVVARQLVFDGSRVGDAWLAASASVDAAALGVSEAQQNVAYDTAEAYLGVLRAEALRDNLDEVYHQANAHLEIAEKLRRDGAGTHYDVLLARTAVARVGEQVVQAENAVSVARLALANVMGEPLEAQPLAPMPPIPTTLLPRDAQAMLDGRDAMLALDQLQQADRHKLDAIQDDRWPTVGLMGFYDQLGASSDRVYGGALVAAWNVFDGGTTTARASEAAAAIQADEARKQMLQRKLWLDLQQVLAKRRLAYERLQVSQQELQSAEAGAEIARLKYKNGAATGYELVDAETMLAQAQHSVIEATYDRADAELKLDRSLGFDLLEMLAPDLEAPRTSTTGTP